MKNKLGVVILLLINAICILLVVLQLQKEPEIPTVNKAQTELITKEKQCYLEALWYEARGEGYEGMYKVAEVIQNRKESGKYPDTACAVIKQPKQFSYRNDLHYDKTLKISYNTNEQEIYDQAVEIANKASQGNLTRTMPETVMWYTTLKIKRSWMKAKEVYTKVGNHKFFKLKEKE